MSSFRDFKSGQRDFKSGQEGFQIESGITNWGRDYKSVQSRCCTRGCMEIYKDITKSTISKSDERIR